MHGGTCPEHSENQAVTSRNGGSQWLGSLRSYAQGDPGNGIGGYDLASPGDRAFAFDYDSSGKLDHLALYRPGTGTIWILKHTTTGFTPVYNQGDPGNGIGGYDLASPSDRAFAFDYDSSGKLDHLALYRPGTGTIWILKHTTTGFTPVYNQGDPGNGIGGYDLASPSDRAFAFDYDSSGKLDHLALYRPGTGTIWILKHTTTGFTPVYNQGDPGNGIGGYDLASPSDRAFAFDYDSSGKLDHLALYRPGTGTIWILKHTTTGFTPVYNQGDPGNGIGGYDLASPSDRAFAFDYDSSGKLDHLALYRPGTGTIWILKHTTTGFTPVYNQGDPGNGIGGYDLASPSDRAFAFDYDSSGKLDHLALYRPGTGTIWILEHQPFVRRDSASLPAQGLPAPWDPVMLAYARGVAVMQARPASDPTSWSYQAAMHATTQTPTRPLWNECQHHKWHFPSWHRMYLYYFERIVRAAVVSVGGPDDFALPYWNPYAGPPRNVLPRAFTVPTLPIAGNPPNPLFVAPPNRVMGAQHALNTNPNSPGSITLPFQAALGVTNFSAAAGSPSFAGSRHAAEPVGAPGRRGRGRDRPRRGARSSRRMDGCGAGGGSGPDLLAAPLQLRSGVGGLAPAGRQSEQPG